MNLRVALFGFGRTSSVVAKEIVNDPNLNHLIAVLHAPNISFGETLIFNMKANNEC